MDDNSIDLGDFLTLSFDEEDSFAAVNAGTERDSPRADQVRMTITLGTEDNSARFTTLMSKAAATKAWKRLKAVAK